MCSSPSRTNQFKVVQLTNVSYARPIVNRGAVVLTHYITCGPHTQTVLDVFSYTKHALPVPYSITECYSIA